MVNQSYNYRIPAFIHAIKIHEGTILILILTGTPSNTLILKLSNSWLLLLGEHVNVVTGYNYWISYH